MKVLHHYHGPFTAGQVIASLKGSFNQRYSHIAIQCQEIQSTIMKTNNPPKYSLRQEDNTLERTTTDLPPIAKENDPIIKVNDEEYSLNEKGILEFDGLASLGVTITALRDLPPETVVDVIAVDVQY